MKNAYSIGLLSSLLILSVGLLASCSGSGSNDLTAGMMGGAGALEEDGFVLTSDPTEIVIDLTDPNAPVDPDTGKVFAEVVLTANAVDETGVPQEGLEVVFMSNAGTLASEGNPVLTDASGNALDTLKVLEDDPDEIEVTATDGTRMEALTLTKTVIFPNRPPVADAGMDQLIECAAAEGTPVTLDGSASTDPDSTPGTNDDIEEFDWFTDYGTPDEALLGKDMVLDGSLKLGVHVITLRVTDTEGETDTDEVTVEIVDTTPPTLSFDLDPSMLWPPNHKMRAIDAMVTASDTCGDVAVTLVSVTSNEPDNGLGDGDTSDDIQGVDAGTEDYSFMLRAERAGGGSGRIYSVMYAAADDSGNGADAGGEVLVPHDMGE